MGAIIGVDPGKTGAIALLAADGSIIECEDMPAPKKNVSASMLGHLLRQLIDAYRPEIAVVERVASSPQMGVTSAFSFGESGGIPLGALAYAAVRVTRPTPSKWKRDMGLAKQDKGASRAMAAERWPADADLFRRVKDNGRAEACLLAAWWLDGHGRAS